MGNTANKRDCADTSSKEGPPAPSTEGKVQFCAGKGTAKFLRASSPPQDYDDIFRDKFDELKHSDTRGNSYPTVFKWNGGGEEVSVCGSFSDWKPIPMVRSRGDFSQFITSLDLPEGDYQYKYKVDDQWYHNINELTVDNDLGTKNNVITVKKSDYLSFEASDNMGFTNKDSPPGSYSQEVPRYTPVEKAEKVPILPSHLMQVTFHKDVPPACELPEPLQVVLHHVYAPSIKDGMISLSAIQRYEGKYVTTLFYKPF